MLTQEAREAEEPAEFEAVLADSRRMAQSGKLTAEHSKALLDAVAQRNGAGIRAELCQLAPELRHAFEVDMGMQAA